MPAPSVCFRRIPFRWVIVLRLYDILISHNGHGDYFHGKMSMGFIIFPSHEFIGRQIPTNDRALYQGASRRLAYDDELFSQRISVKILRAYMPRLSATRMMLVNLQTMTAHYISGRS